jgi:hypothetical protein
MSEPLATLAEFDGWTNYPTWNVHYRLTADDSIFYASRIAAQESTDALREFVTGLTRQNAPGVAADLIAWALSFVEWEEIATALREA